MAGLLRGDSPLPAGSKGRCGTASNAFAPTSVQETGAMADKRTGPRGPDILVHEASEKLRFLVTDHGFHQENHIEERYAKVRFHGDRMTFYLSYDTYRDFDYYAEIKYSKFPRKNPVMLWL